jgi:hypothetical protein
MGVSMIAQAILGNWDNARGSSGSLVCFVYCIHKVLYNKQ